MTFKALLLDDADILVEVVELDDVSQLTPRHVDLRPHGGDADNAPGEYRWDRQAKCLLPVQRAKRPPASGVPSLEQAFYALATGGQTSPVVAAWLAHYEKTIDARGAPGRG